MLIDDRDPPRATSKLRGIIQEKNLFYKKQLKPNNQETLQVFSQIQEWVGLAVEDSKKVLWKKSITENFQINFQTTLKLMENVIGWF